MAPVTLNSLRTEKCVRVIPGGEVGALPAAGPEPARRRRTPSSLPDLEIAATSTKYTCSLDHHDTALIIMVTISRTLTHACRGCCRPTRLTWPNLRRSVPSVGDHPTGSDSRPRLRPQPYKQVRRPRGLARYRSDNICRTGSVVSLRPNNGLFARGQPRSRNQRFRWSNDRHLSLLLLHIPVRRLPLRFPGLSGTPPPERPSHDLRQPARRSRLVVRSRPLSRRPRWPKHALAVSRAPILRLAASHLSTVTWPAI